VKSFSFYPEQLLRYGVLQKCTSFWATLYIILYYIVFAAGTTCYVCELTNMNHVTTVRNRKHALRMVQELDAFPKVPESYQETTATGGGSMLLLV